jgi:hypothetical protein
MLSGTDRKVSCRLRLNFAGAGGGAISEAEVVL